MIFVFGSNEKGYHGAGAALAARLFHGAIMDQGEGLQGQSYAIPTKDRVLSPLYLGKILWYVKKFLEFARQHPELEFEVTKIGTGFAGFRAEQIAPMFRGAPKNCHFDPEWLQYLENP